MLERLGNPSVRPSLRLSLTRTKERTDGKARPRCTNNVTPCRRRCDSSTVSRHKRTDERTNRRWG